MIVMKFGGTSTATPESIRQIASIVRAEIQRKPIVVVSAIANTTDQLIQILRHAALGEVEESARRQADLRDYHLSLASELLTGEEGERTSAAVQRNFRDLHVRMLELAQAEQCLDAELKDWVTSLGEQLSSCIIAATFNVLGMGATHLDSRRLIVTDDCFTNAKPQLWESNARLRWAVAGTKSSGVAVLGGFIGSTRDGRTTTLGRGGSDLTASIVGAALNAECIQVWKDVDGMLTCDPRLYQGGLCVRRLTYPEAELLAQSGAKILHPDTIAPARRLRIPILLRNTFRPQGQGTEISGETVTKASPLIKSIACRKGLHLLRIRPSESALTRGDIFRSVEKSLAQQQVQVSLLEHTENELVMAMDGDTDFSKLVFGFEGCLQVHLQCNQWLFTLVGNAIAGSADIARKLKRATAGLNGAVVLPSTPSSCAVRVAVPEKDAYIFLARIHKSLFANPDWSIFEPATALNHPSNSVETLQDVARAIAKSDGATVWAGHRVLALAQRP